MFPLQSLRRRRPVRPAHARRARLFLEPLEDRVVPATTITFSELQQGPAIGFNGQFNPFLISSDGQFRVEAFWLNTSSHFHIFDGGAGNLAEHNHNNSGGVPSDIQGIRVSRVDGASFELSQMDLYGQAAIGTVTNFTTGAGSFTLYNGSGTFAVPGTTSFGSTFSSVTAIYLADPGRAGGFSSTNSWDNIVLNAFPGNFTPVAPDPRTEPVPFVDITFTKAIDPATFDFNDLTLTRDGGSNLITSAVTVTPLGGNTYRIGNLAAPTTPDGNYTLTISGSALNDSGGTPLGGAPPNPGRPTTRCPRSPPSRRWAA